MSIVGFALVLAAACCHATWNYCVKRINGGAELIWLFSCLTCVLYLPLVLRVFATSEPVLTPLAWSVIGASAALHLGYFLFLQLGYRKGDLSLVYPVARATGPLLSVSFAILFLGEAVTLVMLLGGLLIVGGVLMLTGGLGRGSRTAGASLGFGLGAGLLIGSYTAWDAYAVSVLLVPPLLLDYASSLGRMVLLAPLARRRWIRVRAHWRDHRAAVLAIAVFNPLAYILVLYALTFTPVAYVAPLREVSVLLTVLAGSILLGEGQLRRRLSWAVIILSGMAVLMAA